MKRKKKYPDLFEKTGPNFKPVLLEGIIRLHPRGFGFMQLPEGCELGDEVFIPKPCTGEAVDGDLVQVEISKPSTHEKGPEGKIVAVLKRGRSRVVATVHTIFTKEKMAMAYSSQLPNQQISFFFKKKESFEIGDRLLLEVEDWGTKQTDATGRVVEKIGHIDDPSTDTPYAINEFNLSHAFTDEVVAEAVSKGTRVSNADLSNREDLRHLECFTIDPDTAKDYDDALSLTQDAEGIFHLGVHIADVSHYVPANSALDKEALKRGNSTYFPGLCLPMLPSQLSDNLCSLRANVNRLTVSVLMTFNKEGHFQDYRIARSVIKSRKRMTYREAKAVIDGKKASPHKHALYLMCQLCHLLKIRRRERGSVEFSLPETVILCDAKGIPTGFDVVEYDITHQLVEEFMIKANEMVATHLAHLGKTVIYRIHEDPSPESFEEFIDMARAFGFLVPSKPTAQDLQKLFEAANTSPYGSQLAVHFIRSMRLAYYSLDNVGHYGLGLEYYCHFTSPIRRYVDLTVMRSLFEKIAPTEIIAQHCSDRERLSAKAESSVVALKKLRYIDHLQKNADSGPLVMEAIVTQVKRFGISFDLTPLSLDGFIHVSDLHDDYYIYNDRVRQLEGRHSGKKYACGDLLQVELVSIDLTIQQTRWALYKNKNASKKVKSKKRR